jgi:hypothetical protein
MTRPIHDEMISAYLDGELAADERARVEQAMNNRVELRQLHDELLVLRQALQALPACPMEEDLVERALQAGESRSVADRTGDARALRKEAGDGASPRTRRWPVLVAAVASMAAMLSLVLWLPQWQNTQVAQTSSAPDRAAGEERPEAAASSVPEAAAGDQDTALPSRGAAGLRGARDDSRAFLRDEMGGLAERGRTNEPESDIEMEELAPMAPPAEIGGGVAPPAPTSNPDVADRFERDAAAGGMGGRDAASAGDRMGEASAFDAAPGRSSGHRAFDMGIAGKGGQAKAGGYGAGSLMGIGPGMGKSAKMPKSQSLSSSEVRLQPATVDQVMLQLQDDQMVMLNIGLNPEKNETGSEDLGQVLTQLQRSGPPTGGGSASADTAGRNLFFAFGQNSQEQELVQQIPGNVNGQQQLYVVEGSADEVRQTLVGLEKQADVALSLPEPNVSAVVGEQVLHWIDQQRGQSGLPTSAGELSATAPKPTSRLGYGSRFFPPADGLPSTSSAGQEASDSGSRSRRKSEDRPAQAETWQMEEDLARAPDPSASPAGAAVMQQSVPGLDDAARLGSAAERFSRQQQVQVGKNTAWLLLRLKSAVPAKPAETPSSPTAGQPD